MILPGISWPSFKESRLGKVLPGQARSGLPPAPRWHLIFQDSPGMTGKGGGKIFADNGGWTFQRTREKSKGDRQEKERKKEIECIWK